MSKISVIVPVYNSEKYIDKCLNSIINQTYQNIEIIIVNDGSTDSSEQIINKYIEKYPNLIKYFYINHYGVAYARNYGIDKASGSFFIFVDSDDYIELNLISELIKYINIDSSIDMIKYKIQVTSENNIEKIHGPVFSITTGENAFNKLCFSDVLIDTPCLYLIKTSFLKQNNFKFLENTYREDFGLMPLLIITSQKFLSIDFYGYNYFKSENSITRNSDYNKKIKMMNDLFLHYDNMNNYINTIKLSPETIINIKQYYTNGILLGIKQLKKEDRKKYILEFKNNHLIKNFKPKNLKQIIKKIILFFDVNLYLHFI